MNKIFYKKLGFTLIEALVAVFIFMILFLITASFVNLAAGSTKSRQTKILTSEIRNALDVINQKMNNANAKTTGTNIYGFKLNGTVLGIANTDGATTTCTYIGQVGTGIYMRYDSCSSWPTLTADDSPLTNTNTVNVTGFDLNPGGVDYFMTNNSPARSPYLKISITAQDADPKYQSENVINLQTSYTMSYQTIRRLKSQ